MKIVLVGLFYPMAILRYFEAALRRRNDVELFTIGPYTNTWIPWKGGMHLPQKYAIAPNWPLPKNSLIAPINFVESKLPWKPDLWLQVDAGWHLDGRPQYGKNIIVATDPHVLNYDMQRALADIFYCMQATYAQPGDEYLPYAYDPIWHAPEEQPRLYDACLIGLHYQQRDALVAALREHGLNIYYDLGPCFDEARKLYNQAPIGLNWSSAQDLTARVFELLGMRRLAVVNKVPDLAKFFEDGSDLLAFDTLEEAIDKALFALERPAEAEKIARSGKAKAREHTWDARVARILS